MELLNVCALKGSLNLNVHEDPNIWQKSRNFRFAVFFLRFLKSLGWYGFFKGFLVVWNLFHPNLKFNKCCFIKDDPQKHFVS